VVQELSKSLVAKILVRAREQYELVPEIIDHLGRHGHALAAALEVREKELPQRARHQLLLLHVQPRPRLVEFFEHTGGEHEAADELLAAPLPAVRLEDSGATGDRDPDDGDGTDHCHGCLTSSGARRLRDAPLVLLNPRERGPLRRDPSHPCSMRTLLPATG
jgi:hypothetical protein